MYNDRMKRWIFVFAVFTFLCISAPQKSMALDRLAECDACGYCQGQVAPDNWASCAQCLYETKVASGDAATMNKTLELDLITNRAIPPDKGKYYTQLGCLDTGLTSFRDDPGAAGALVNFILSTLIFPVVGTLAFATIIYAAFLLATAQGDQMKIQQGKRLLTSSIVGVVFTVSVVFIINFIAGDVLKIPGFAKGTKITFVGYGTATTEGGVKTYPDMDIDYYPDPSKPKHETIGTIKSLKGDVNNQETRIVYVSKKIDVTHLDDVKKVRFVFTNDLCLACQNIPSGDRNIRNYSLLFDDKVCSLRNVRPPTYGPKSGNDELINNWGGAYYTCEDIAP